MTTDTPGTPYGALAIAVGATWDVTFDEGVQRVRVERLWDRRPEGGEPTVLVSSPHLQPGHLLALPVTMVAMLAMTGRLKPVQPEALPN